MTSCKPSKYPLPYFADSAQLFAPLAAKPWAVLLDSARPYCQQGRFDIIASDPVCTLETWGRLTSVKRGDHQFVSTDDPFMLVRQELGERRTPLEDIPFNGGALGYFSYDLARRLEKLPTLARDDENIAEMAVGIYSWAVIVDHQRQESWLVGHESRENDWETLIDQFSLCPAEVNYAPFKVLSKPRSNMDFRYYANAFSRIKSYLKEGDSYQVNLAQRFMSRCAGHPWSVFQRLRQINAAPFSAYLNFPEAQVLCSSPERFLKVTDNEVESRPIKGTRPRKPSLRQDERQVTELSTSEKDRAENIMIVDLLRNDISKNCQTGSVSVPKLFAVESYATVHHLVSIIKGKLRQGHHALDLLKGCFPGGSITGAPKIRAMQIIEELEPNRRGVYCGAIGYIGFDGNMDTNIAIRTLVHSAGTIRFWAGGGIVNDSVLEDEYQECFDKALALLEVLEHFRLS